MENNTIELMKYFSLALKRRTKDEDNAKTINPGLLKYFGRKELIEVIHYKSNGDSPDADQLMEMENEELLQLIEDELYILAYVVKQWCKDLEKAKAETGVKAETEIEAKEKVETEEGKEENDDSDLKKSSSPSKKQNSSAKSNTYGK